MSNPDQWIDVHLWQPWRHSTGAKTPQGKQASKMNALKSGRYTKEAIATRKARAAAKRRLRNMTVSELYELIDKMVKN